MNDFPSFIRRVCLAKRCELLGDRAIAIQHLDAAGQITPEPDDIMQIAT